MKLMRDALGITLILLLFLPAFAATPNQAQFTLRDTVKVAGVQLAPGNYIVKWQGEGANAQVNILQGTKVAATTTASVINAANTFIRDAATHLKTQTDGTKVLTRIDLAKKSIVFEPDAQVASGK